MIRWCFVRMLIRSSPLSSWIRAPNSVQGEESFIRTFGGWRWTESEETLSPTKNVPIPFPNCSRSKTHKKKTRVPKQNYKLQKFLLGDSICSTAIISSWSLTLKLLMFQQLIFVIQIQAPVGSGETRLKTKRRSMCHRPIDLPNPKLHHLRSISLPWRACFGVMIPRPSY